MEYSIEGSEQERFVAGEDGRIPILRIEVKITVFVS